MYFSPLINWWNHDAQKIKQVKGNMDEKCIDSEIQKELGDKQFFLKYMCTVHVETRHFKLTSPFLDQI